MRNIKLVVAYDGTEYHGWERQKGHRTIQETLEDAIQSLTGQTVRVLASGRTDAGVHALGQVVHFRTPSSYPAETFVRALNFYLPPDIVVRSAEEAPADFHANFHARCKLYRYIIHDSPVPDPFSRRYAFHSKFRLDAEAMHRGAQYLLGTHDFHSFETEWPNRASSVRTITHISVGRAGPWQLWRTEPITGGAKERGTDMLRDQGPGVRDQGSELRVNNGGPTPAPDPRPLTPNPQPPRPLDPSVPQPLDPLIPRSLSPFIHIDVAADGFLYNMVRAIAGTLIQVGRGHWPEEKVREILEARDRCAAGPTAPALGLFLVRVEY